MAITINGTTGISGVDGSASTPAVQGTDTNTGIFFPAADTIAFGEGGTESMRIDSSGRVGIGETNPVVNLQIKNTAGSAALRLQSTETSSNAQIDFIPGNQTNPYYIYVNPTRNLIFQDNATERARITSDGTFMVAKTTVDSSTQGLYANPAGSGFFHLVVTNTTSTSTQSTLYLNRQTSDGRLIEFRQADTSEGDISVSGTTVSYNGGHLSRYAQTTTAKDDSLLKGTVLANLDEMNVYVAPTTYWTEKDELSEGVNVGDVKVETHTVNNEQLNKVKVSDVEGDVNVAGVFVNWSHDEAHQVDEINMAMTGDMIIRIAQGVVVQKGDLLMSAGDGTAKPQGDDIVRSKTIAKVTSNHVTCTYEDGSYCVPCVLMAC